LLNTVVIYNYGILYVSHLTTQGLISNIGSGKILVTIKEGTGVIEDAAQEKIAVPELLQSLPTLALPPKPTPKPGVVALYPHEAQLYLQAKTQEQFGNSVPKNKERPTPPIPKKVPCIVVVPSNS
jgi:hypothetical protein